MYVVFEGIDTCGKSTQIELLKEYFSNAIFTKEPGGTQAGKVFRDIILNNGLESKNAEMFLFLADRAEHFESIVKPNLNGLIISDRSFISGLAYAIANGFEDEELLIKLNLLSLQNTTPDLIIFIKTDEQTIKNRFLLKNDDKIEARGIEYLLNIQSIMAKIIKKLNLNLFELDAKSDIDMLHKKILDKLNSIK